MAPTTPTEWLPVLTKRLDDRYPRMALLRSYTDGTSPMPEMGKNLRTSWVAFQRKACTNYGGLAVESLANRMIPNGISIGESEDNELVRRARRIWRDNRMDVVVADAIRDALTCSVGYLVVGSSEGRAVVTREMPEQFIAAVDPLRPWKARAGLKVWRDIDDNTDYAYVWVPGQRQLFARPSQIRPDDVIVHQRSTGGQWLPVGPAEVYLGEPPIIILERHAGIGLFEPHIPVIDRINLGKLQRMVTTAMQAFKQRALKGSLPTEDQDGNSIDYDKVFEPAPGALWELPDGIDDIWESEAVDIRPLLEGEKSDARDFAAVTRTPISVFIPEGANQSAEGAAAAKEGQVFQARDEIARITPGIEVAIVHALRVEGVELGDATVELLWTPPEHVSLTERYEAASKAKAAGESWQSIQKNILGRSPDQIKQDAEYRATEQLQLLALTGGTGGNV